MAKFMLLLHSVPGEFTSLSPAEMQEIIGKYRAWSQGLRDKGQMISGEKLRDDVGKVLRHTGATIAVKDGPYPESKEMMGGYFMVEAADYAAAVEIAKGCPHIRPGYTGAIEIRQIHET